LAPLRARRCGGRARDAGGSGSVAVGPRPDRGGGGAGGGGGAPRRRGLLRHTGRDRVLARARGAGRGNGLAADRRLVFAPAAAPPLAGGSAQPRGGGGDGGEAGAGAAADRADRGVGSAVRISPAAGGEGGHPSPAGAAGGCGGRVRTRAGAGDAGGGAEVSAAEVAGGEGGGLGCLVARAHRDDGRQELCGQPWSRASCLSSV